MAAVVCVGRGERVGMFVGQRLCSLGSLPELGRDRGVDADLDVALLGIGERLFDLLVDGLTPIDALAAIGDDRLRSRDLFVVLLAACTTTRGATKDVELDDAGADESTDGTTTTGDPESSSGSGDPETTTSETESGGAPNCADWVMVEGYSRELASAGFWPGGGEEGAFYAYAYPEPDGFADHPVEPGEARYVADAGQFRLPYEIVRTAADPDRMLLAFLRSTYAAAADLGDWDRGALDYRPVLPD